MRLFCGLHGKKNSISIIAYRSAWLTFWQEKMEAIYDDLSVERKSLVIPIQLSVKERVKQWQDEVYEKNLMYPDNLQYET